MNDNLHEENVFGEIRIKKQKGISDEVAIKLVYSVISIGKISGEGKHYCYLTAFNHNGDNYNVLFDERRKTKFFKIYKD